MNDANQKRRLATILAADVVGYSALMAADEEATLRTLNAHRLVIDKLIDRHDGHIFNTAGDSVLAEFGSAVEAVRCAIAIQEELRIRNTELSHERQMRFRIGINIGDVLVVGGDLLGDGVNVAARLESIARPGGICISGSTFEQVKNKLSIGFEDLGLHVVKNIPEPVSAFSVTSGPVTIKREPAAVAATAQAPQAPRAAPVATARRVGWGLTGLALGLLVAIGVGWWVLQRPDGVAPLSAFPASTSTDEMRADQVKAFMTGMTIRGNRNIDGQPFTIVINPDFTANYEFARQGGLQGTVERITGVWRAEDYRFCMKIKRFAFGEWACPLVVKDGPKLTAINKKTGNPQPWTLHK